MKRIFFPPLLAVIALTLLFIIFSFSDNTYSVQTTLHDALKSNTISADAISNGKYSGKSVQLTLKNNTKQSIKLLIPAGTTYAPENDDEQTLIQMEEQLITLAPNGSTNASIGAFCTESNDRCPTESNAFKIGKSSNPKFEKLVNYVKGKNISKTTYQDAVWAVSDNKSVSHIDAELPVDKEFRKFVASITGQKDTWYTTPQNVSVDEQGNFNHETVLIHGDLSFTCARGAKVYQDIHKGNGEVFFQSNRSMTAASGNVHYNFRLSVRGWERGKYYIRIHDGTKELSRYEFEI